jgi:hypothetical protein
MTEMVVTIAIVGAVMVGGVQLMAVTARHSREAENRQLATTEAGNVLEQVMTRPWNGVSPDSPALADLTLSDACRQALPDARLSVVVSPEADSPGRRITVHIDWATNPAHRSQGIRLVAWRYPAQETQP